MLYQENTLSCEDYCRLRESVGWINFSPEQTEYALDHSCYTVTALKNGQTVGMGRLIGDGLYYTVVDVVVQPEYQGQGIGRQILTMLLNWGDRTIQSGGRSSVQLIAEKGKEPFYEKFGFQRLPHENCGSGMRRIVHGTTRASSKVFPEYSKKEGTR